MSQETRNPSAFEGKIRNKQRQLFGERYVGASISTLRCPIFAQEAISQFMKKPKNFLVYCGSPGIGKTYFCAAMMEWIIPNFNNFRYWNETELFKRIRSSMNEYNSEQLETLKFLIDDEIVIIDDIGFSGPNEWRNMILSDLIDERYNTMQPTIFTSNYSKKEFETIYHARVSSRLFASENIIIEIPNGPDLRKENL